MTRPLAGSIADPIPGPETAGATFLADGNVLIAFVIREHVHHEAATQWFARLQPRLATCPITQGTLVRFMLRSGFSGNDAVAALDAIGSQPWHEFWPDELACGAEMLRGVIGHRQVTDAYLAALAASRQTRVATLDQGLAAFRPADIELIPT